MAHPGSWKEAPATGRQDKAHGSWRNPAGNGLISSLSGWFLNLQEGQLMLSVRRTGKRLESVPSPWKLVPGRISQVMEKEEGILDGEQGGCCDSVGHGPEEERAPRKEQAGSQGCRIEQGPGCEGHRQTPASPTAGECQSLCTTPSPPPPSHKLTCQHTGKRPQGKPQPDPTRSSAGLLGEAQDSPLALRPTMTNTLV